MSRKPIRRSGASAHDEVIGMYTVITIVALRPYSADSFAPPAFFVRSSSMASCTRKDQVKS